MVRTGTREVVRALVQAGRKDLAVQVVGMVPVLQPVQKALDQVGRALGRLDKTIDQLGSKEPAARRTLMELATQATLAYQRVEREMDQVSQEIHNRHVGRFG